MKVKYTGPSMGATGPQDGGVYQVTGIRPGQLLVIDENADGEAYWYDAVAPAMGGYSGGRFTIAEDEGGQLARAGVPPAEGGSV